MRFPQYPAYQASRVEWADPIPRDWTVRPLFTVLKERRYKNAGNREANVLSLSYGRIVQRDVESNFGLLPESFETYQIVEPNSVVMRLTDLQNDQRSLRVGRVVERGIITSAYVALDPREGIDPGYAYYLLHAYDLLKVYYGLGGGLRQTMKFEDLKRIPFLLPELGEQRAIAAMLGRETAKLDTLIAKQERLIDLLQEKRQAVISHAVTKGLDPKVPMRDSGVEWLGEVPAHWRVTRLKFAASDIVDCPHETPIYNEDGDYLVIRTADIERGTLLSEALYRLTEVEYKRRTRRKALSKSDIVYGREGERWGHAALVPEPNRYCLGQRMMQFRASGRAHPEFLMWQLNAASTYRQGQQDTVGATSPHVNVETIRNYWLAEPPFTEQADIAKYICVRTGMIDKLISRVRRSIDLMRERRAALISAAVTGKIDVREAA